MTSVKDLIAEHRARTQRAMEENTTSSWQEEHRAYQRIIDLLSGGRPQSSEVSLPQVT